MKKNEHLPALFRTGLVVVVMTKFRAAGAAALIAAMQPALTALLAQTNSMRVNIAKVT